MLRLISLVFSTLQPSKRFAVPVLSALRCARFCTLSLWVVACAGCYDSAPVPEPLQPAPPVVTTTLAELRRLYAGATFEVTSEVVVAGRVTSDDRAGNFYRTLTFESDGAAAELMAGISDLSMLYPEGSTLTVSLRGLAVGESRGILQIGRMPEAGSGFATDYLGSRAALDRHVVCSGTPEMMQPFVIDIPSLTPRMAGRLVRIDGVHFEPDSGVVELAEWSGTKRFVDADGNVIETYTSLYAHFAEQVIPAGELLLVGILQCTATDDIPRYSLKLRHEKDCLY